MPNLSTREIIDNMYNGTTAIKRQNPKAGETPYYYLNPNRKNFYSTPAPEDIANVNSPDDPNPFLQPQKPSGLSATSSTMGSAGLTDTTNANNGLFNSSDTSGTTSHSSWNNQTSDMMGDIWNTTDSWWNSNSSVNNDNWESNNNLYSSAISGTLSSMGVPINETSWMSNYNQYLPIPDNSLWQNKTLHQNDFSNHFDGVPLTAAKGTANGIYSAINRTIDMFNNSPSREKSLVHTAYNLAKDYNGHISSPQEYKTQDPVSPQNSLLENAVNYWKQYKTMQKEHMSDVNKHQYMGCLAGRDGIAFGLTGLAAGAGKEIKDFANKCIDEKQRKAYGGLSGILADGVKDMNNNIKGFYHGFVDNKPCYPLLTDPLP